MRCAKSIILSLSLGLAALSAAAAAPQETVTMRNGTVYMGETSAKDLKKKSFTFLVDSAIVVTDIDKIDFTSEQRLLSNLKTKWQNWFYAHPSMIKRNASGEQVVNMYVAHERGNRDGIDDIVIIERTPSQIKYVTLDQQRKEIPIADVLRFDFAPRSIDDVSGVTDKIFTSTTSYTGQIVYEDAKYIGILTDENIVEMVPVKERVRTEIHPLLVSQPIVEQVPFLDYIETDDRAYTGIITSVVYRPGEADVKPYYTVNLLDGYEAAKVPFSKVLNISRRPNNAYNPVTDFSITSPDSIYASNTLLYAETPVTFKVKDQSYFAFDDNVEPEAITAKDGIIEIVLKDTPANQVMMLLPIDRNSQQKVAGKNMIYCFSPSDLITSAQMSIKRETTPLGNIKLQYAVKTGSDYILYRQSDRNCYFITIE